jgi:hypothetical protein
MWIFLSFIDGHFILFYGEGYSFKRAQKAAKNKRAVFLKVYLFTNENYQRVRKNKKNLQSFNR